MQANSSRTGNEKDRRIASVPLTRAVASVMR